MKLKNLQNMLGKDVLERAEKEFHTKGTAYVDVSYNTRDFRKSWKILEGVENYFRKKAGEAYKRKEDICGVGMVYYHVEPCLRLWLQKIKLQYITKNGI